MSERKPIPRDQYITAEDDWCVLRFSDPRDALNLIAAVADDCQLYLRREVVEQMIVAAGGAVTWGKEPGQ